MGKTIRNYDDNDMKSFKPVRKQKKKKAKKIKHQFPIYDCPIDELDIEELSEQLEMFE